MLPITTSLRTLGHVSQGLGHVREVSGGFLGCSLWLDKSCKRWRLRADSMRDPPYGSQYWWDSWLSDKSPTLYRTALPCTVLYLTVVHSVLHGWKDRFEGRNCTFYCLQILSAVGSLSTSNFVLVDSKRLDRFWCWWWMRMVEPWSEDLTVWKRSVWSRTLRGWLAAEVGWQELHLWDKMEGRSSML